MPVNNFDIVRTLMHFECDGDIYFLEIIARGKDVGTTGERLIRDYHIHSLDQLDELKPGIIGQCDMYSARAYIRLNQRNIEDANIYAQIEMLKAQLDRNRTYRKMLRTGNTNTVLHGKMNKLKSATKVYGSVLGQYSSEDRATSKWIIDIDADRVRPGEPGFGSVEEIADTYSAFIKDDCEQKGVDKEICRIPSRTGIHLVARPFNVKAFNDRFGKDANGDSFVKSDGITNLYIPDFPE